MARPRMGDPEDDAKALFVADNQRAADPYLPGSSLEKTSVSLWKTNSSEQRPRNQCSSGWNFMVGDLVLTTLHGNTDT
ncbi:MAG: hypothetical protein GOMPHAMPRED_005510 [Gomphillus americanus]|uniref:Uncharacterized protein n=1 Tax=Gomphillus americanus TaxID=1940652 RepID=A0A8H3FY76_9LECA|nr:MAG: hypothetical protein GOMPHAMPRED_005510 [Gomphillus americanus]